MKEDNEKCAYDSHTQKVSDLTLPVPHGAPSGTSQLTVLYTSLASIPKQILAPSTLTALPSVFVVDDNSDNLFV